MAREERKHVSIKPSEHAQGGTLGFPVGGVVTIEEISWATWEEAGESALKGGREADDPALKITGSIDGVEERKTEFLGAGKANRFQPSSDGEFLDPAEGSTATALNDSCNAAVFLTSLTDKKRHGKLALPEDMLGEGISSLVGLKFVVGKELVKRDGLEMGDRKARPTLVSDENRELPGKAGRKGRSDDEDEAPARSSKSAKKPANGAADDDVDLDEVSEQTIMELLGQPKNRKGLPVTKVFSQVYNATKEHGDSKAITALVSDSDWLEHKSRPWKVEDDMIVLP